ncbi:MAG: HNH endonuclease signature motif containing protein [Armatimonadota bacterium]
MSETLKGRPKPWLRGRRRPDEVRDKIRAWWTDDRREEKRRELLKRNPDSTYHGLSPRERKKIRETAGRCENCGDDGSGSRLDVHHRNGDKRDQRPPNLAVLCHRCHMQEHARRGETGWHEYHRKRRLNPD